MVDLRRGQQELSKQLKNLEGVGGPLDKALLELGKIRESVKVSIRNGPILRRHADTLGGQAMPDPGPALARLERASVRISDEVLALKANAAQVAAKAVRDTLDELPRASPPLAAHVSTKATEPEQSAPCPQASPPTEAVLPPGPSSGTSSKTAVGASQELPEVLAVLPPEFSTSQPIPSSQLEGGVGVVPAWAQGLGVTDPSSESMRVVDDLARHVALGEVAEYLSSQLPPPMPEPTLVSSDETPVTVQPAGPLATIAIPSASATPAIAVVEHLSQPIYDPTLSLPSRSTKQPSRRSPRLSLTAPPPVLTASSRTSTLENRLPPALDEVGAESPAQSQGKCGFSLLEEDCMTLLPARKRPRVSNSTAPLAVLGPSSSSSPPPPPRAPQGRTASPASSTSGPSVGGAGPIRTRVSRAEKTYRRGKRQMVQSDEED